MVVLLDTNILLRLAVPVHPMHLVARHAVIKLQANGDFTDRPKQGLALAVQDRE